LVIRFGKNKGKLRIAASLPDILSNFLCAAFVFSVPLWWIYHANDHQRDTDVQRVSNYNQKTYCAAAPDTTSMISLVIAAWRTRFMLSVSESISSRAFLEAESIAVMRAPCSEAIDS